MNNKLLVAKSGFNALTESNPDNFRFHSDYNTLKYYLAGNYDMTIPANGGGGSLLQTIVHNLDYTPFFIAYCNDVIAQPTFYGLTEYFNSIGQFIAARAYVDATNLYLSVNYGAAGSALTLKWYYKIFKNNLNL